MHRILLRLWLLFLAIVFALPASGQNLYVGSNSANQTTNFTSGYNSYNNTYIGYNPNDSNNTLNVLGSNTVLMNTIYYLWVGYSGSYNRLIISNGGSAYSFYGVIGGGYSNSALVTGKGSLWSNLFDMEVGSGGQGKCSLVVSNGGIVDSFNTNNNSGIITIGSESSNNSVVVTGAGSELNTGSLNLGTGSGNSLVISKGGVVTSQNAQISFNDSAIGLTNASSNNSVLVTGTGSLWTNSGTISVGDGSSGGGVASGSLTVGTGGTVASQTIVISSQSNSVGTLNIGTLGGTDTNVSLITQSISFGGGLGMLNFNQSNSMTISIPILGNGSVNQLGRGTTILTGSNSFSGGILVSKGSLQLGPGGNANLYLGTGSGDSGNLVVTGGTLNNDNSTIGNSSNSTGSATVSGGVWNNFWNTRGSITVGNYGSGTLTIGVTGVVKAQNIYLATQLGSAGTLNLGNGNAAGSLQAGSVIGGSGTAVVNFEETNGTYTFSPTLTGNLTFNQLGIGKTTLTASNSFSGPTYVNAGALLIASTGTLSGGGIVTVSTGATLENNGLITGNTTVNGTLAGNGGGFNNLQVAAGSSLIWNVSSFTGTAGTNWDELNAFSLDLSALSSTNPLTIYVEGISGTAVTNAPSTYVFNFLNVSNSVTGFDSSKFTVNTSLFTADQSHNGGAWSVGTNSSASGTELTLTYAVPEPTSCTLLVLGVLTLGIACRRRRV